MRRNKNCCIDSCVWVKYAGHNKIAVLLKHIQVNSLIVFADNYLLGEVHKTLINEFDFSIAEANRVIYLIESFVIIKLQETFTAFAMIPKTTFFTISVFKIIASFYKP